MQQRRPPLRAIPDDYCPRERRITNHVIVAMIEDEVKQTRCSTCDADHEYKQARIPPQRRKRSESSAADGDPVESTLRPRTDDAGSPAETFDLDTDPAAASLEAAADSADGEAVEDPTTGASDDEGPVHRRLIRATLPRPEGQ